MVSFGNDAKDALVTSAFSRCVDRDGCAWNGGEGAAVARPRHLGLVVSPVHAATPPRPFRRVRRDDDSA